ncbi:hypothetical protein [Bifidobacterium magnum]|uniref:Uncharacterized protein n=1 Tax=Bifidobacterium magnum TaxID=1692 RepID=A0A087BEU7_9BIFI|nr:hypothetical protein [Bifidobacterium magnum]KFI69547.1 hypothetical protein BMAGN_1264 [Bifidobacterium magnum]
MEQPKNATAATPSAGDANAHVIDARPWGWSFAVQIVAYVLLAVLALISGAHSVAPGEWTFSLTTTVVVVMMLLLAFFDPFNSSISGRVIALVCGLLSMIVVTTTVFGSFVFHGVESTRMSDGKEVQYVMPQAWLMGAGCLLVCLIMAGFISQMAREHRTDLIEHLSANVLSGVCSIAAAGWCYLPAMFDGATIARADGSHELHVAWLVGIIAIVVVAVALAVASWRWNRDLEPYAGAHSPWLGLGLMPVMLTGAAVGVAALANALC